MYNQPVNRSASTKRRVDSGGSTRTPTHVQARRDARKARLTELGYASYGDYLRSDCWQATRRLYFASQMPRECLCGDVDVQLHHVTYERLGNENLTDLLPLCRTCHQMVHALEARGEIGLDLEGLVLDEERSAEGRALLADLVRKRQQEAAQHLAEEQARVLSLSFAARVTQAVKAAERRRLDVSRQVWMIGSLAEKNRGDHRLTYRLRILEEIAYRWEGWADELRSAA